MNTRVISHISSAMAIASLLSFAGCSSEPSGPDELVEAGFSELEAGEFDAAYKHFSGAIPLLEEAAAPAKRLLEVRTGLVRAAAQSSNTDSVGGALNDLFENHEKMLRPKDLKLLGSTLGSAKLVEESIDTYVKAMELFPEEARDFYRLRLGVEARAQSSLSPEDEERLRKLGYLQGSDIDIEAEMAKWDAKQEAKKKESAGGEGQ